jgi:hypothetical protein
LAAEAALAFLLVVIDTTISVRQSWSIAALHDRAATAELELAKIKEPRTITDANKVKLLQCLRAAPKGKVYIRPSMLDTDGPRLAKELEKTFKDAGFDVPLWPDGSSLAWSMPGIFLIAHHLVNAPPHIAAIQR